jgi:ADP-ribose pyrophosphatase YjhB (NUDIX family)
LVFIVNEQEEILLLAHPKRGGSWEVVNGALEAGETVVEGALRETREEAGAEVQVRPLGTVHVSTFHYNESVRYMLSVGYLMAYEGGRVQPGDDMAGSRHRWWGLDDLIDEQAKVLVPPNGEWLIARAVKLYRMWRGRERELQPELVVPQGTKPK